MGFGLNKGGGWGFGDGSYWGCYVELRRRGGGGDLMDEEIGWSARKDGVFRTKEEMSRSDLKEVVLVDEGV